MRKKKEIKIFVSHRVDKQCETVGDPLFYPIRCGAVYDKQENSVLPGDDTGDHISYKHPYLSELTVQYWSWKNVKADYYGLCHYRRYLNFSGRAFRQDAFGNVLENFIHQRTIAKYGLTEEKMRAVIESCDLVTAQAVDVGRLPGHFKNVKEHYYKSCGYLRKKDIDLMEAILHEKYPQYGAAADAYLYGRKGYFCNLYVMKRNVFLQYCSWLFPILEELERRLDLKNYCEEAKRTLGHLAERLFGIYLTYLEANTCLRIRQLQTVVFLKPELQQDIRLDKEVIPIVFAANNKFAGPLSVAVQSVIDAAGCDRRYAVVILESDLTEQNQALLQRQVSEKPNIQIRFYNARALVDGYDLKAHNHISIETFYRFLIQEILPDCDKAIYLDGDLIVKKDLAQLYDTDITGYSFAAVRDVDFIGQINGAAGHAMEYAKNKLRLKDPYAYAQAGVLLLNLYEMRRQYSMEGWLKRASKDYRYSDQDVLNKYCQGKIYELDQRWNTIFDCDFNRIRTTVYMAPEELYKAYLRARKDPYIVHYAGFQKPWKHLPADFGDEFWTAAKRTPFYELLLYELHEQRMWDIANFHYDQCHRGLLSRARGKLFWFVETVFPLGTKRRDFLHLVRIRLRLMQRRRSG